MGLCNRSPWVFWVGVSSLVLDVRSSVESLGVSGFDSKLGHSVDVG